MFTGVNIYIGIFLNTTLYNLVGEWKCFRGTHYNFLETTLKMEAIFSCETTVWHTAICHYPEDCNLFQCLSNHCIVHILMSNKYTLLLLKVKDFHQRYVGPSWNTNISKVFGTDHEWIKTEFWQMIVWICHAFFPSSRSKTWNLAP
jgi:hypothetical protein